MAPPASDTAATRGAGRRDEVLAVLRRARASLSVADVAESLGVHPNTARFHLDKLVGAGQVERVAVERGTPGRPPHLFRVMPGMDRAGPREYRVLAEALAGPLLSDPDPAARAVEAGRAWGRGHAATAQERPASGEESVTRLTGVLDELGFAPELDTDQAPAAASQIRLRHCPFLELASTAPEVTCPVHLGLMQGAMEAWEAPVTVDRLDPFVEPDLCVAHLAATTGA